MGSEITYTHLFGKTYQINVTLYRDCGGKKLNGQGGGTSTENSTDLTEAYIRTISTACQNKNIGNGITLSKIDYENITKICNPQESKCGTNSTYPFGVEAHHYSGTIDFNSYTEYQGCSFHIFISKKERSGANILTSSGDDIYNFVFIDPWKENVSSPTFGNVPSFFYNLNQPVYGSEYASNSNGDSLAYKWVNPQRAYNTNINYIGGYSAQNFIRTHCPNGDNCSPDPSAYPPQGLFLDPHTGDYIFTPTQSNQTSIRVLEVEQWREINGSTYLASKIRRDVQTTTLSSSQNNSPKINSYNEYNLCIGQPFTLNISATDLAANGIDISSDSVLFTAESSLSELTQNNKSITTRPYNYLQLSYTPTIQDTGKHYIRIKARDSHCPKYGKSYKTIQLNVLPRDKASLQIEEIFCGNNQITFNTQRSSEFTLAIYNQGILINDTSQVTSPYLYTNPRTQNQVYQLRYTDNYGCTDTVENLHSNKGTLGVSKARLIGATTLCEGSDLVTSLSHNVYTISDVNWRYNGALSMTDTLVTEVENGILKYQYTLTSNNLTCPLQDSTQVIERQGPSIIMADTYQICFDPIIDLNTISASPANGVWQYGTTAINTAFDISTILPNVDTSIRVSYNVMDEASQCLSSKRIYLKILKAPVIKLQDQYICGNDNVFRLKNGITIPFNLTGENITWRPLNNVSAYIATPEPHIDIPSFSPRTYKVEATNRTTGLCQIIDTITIVVDDNLVLQVNDNRTICQGNEPLDLNEYFQVNATGGAWQATENSLSFTSNHHYIPSLCGANILRYTYDRNNCFAEIEFPIQTICKPTFSTSIPSEICADYEQIQLEQKYSWKGAGVSSNILRPTLLPIGKQELIATQTADICAFDTIIQYTIIPPLTYSALSSNTKICEDETLEITLASSSDFTIDVLTCASSVTKSSQQIFTYTPSNCDLQNEEISISFISKSMAMCPSHFDTLAIAYFAKPKASISKPIIGCEPLDLDITFTTLSGNNIDYKYTLKSDYQTFNGVGNTLQYTDLKYGEYSLTTKLSDDNGCKNETTQDNIVVVYPKPKAEFTMANKDRLALSERELLLNNFSSSIEGPLNSKWFYAKNGKSTLFSTYSSPIYELPADTGRFQIMLIASSAKECSDTFTTHVVLVPDIIAFIPNAFTPDNKGPESNATFSVISDHAQAFKIEIYNKWGQKVFESKDINNSWDGTFLGQHCPNGVYVYSIDLINKTGVEYSYQGTVNLIR
ncbi:MAG: gliding motility-associated-like protein [Bacteroidia bacterium]|jgi:gliding motility-associated-like protein